MTATALILPMLPPESRRIEIPESMNEQDQARLTSELAGISTEIARVVTRDEERQKFLDQRFKSIDARISKLEHTSDATGKHDRIELERQLAARIAESGKWKWWALGIGASLASSALVGLVVHYLSSKG